VGLVILSRVGFLSWSMRALVACVAAEIASIWVITRYFEVGSLGWPILLVPLVLAALPVAVPNRALQIAAAALTAFWCFAMVTSVGLFFVPCALLMVVAAAGRREIR
jgi:hypothetical protein